MGSTTRLGRAGGHAYSRLIIRNTEGYREPDWLHGHRQPRLTILGQSDESP